MNRDELFAQPVAQLAHMRGRPDLATKLHRRVGATVVPARDMSLIASDHCEATDNRSEPSDVRVEFGHQSWGVVRPFSNVVAGAGCARGARSRQGSLPRMAARLIDG